MSHLSLRHRIKRLEVFAPSQTCREAIILEDLISPEGVEEDEGILGISDCFFGEPPERVWMRQKGESLSDLRTRVGREAGCMEGELCLFDAVR